MRRNSLTFVACVVAILSFSSPGAGRPDKEKAWFGHVAGGYSSPQASAGDLVDPGWLLEGGALYRPREWPVGIDVGLGYNEYDIASEALSDIQGATGGDIEIWSLTADAMWGPRTGGPVSAYVVGGVGGYYLHGEPTEPGIYTGDSATEFGYNVGAGITFQVGRGSQIFLEATYHRVATSPTATEYIPIVLGYRW